MKILSFKTIVFVLVFVTFFSIFVYATYYDFCSLVPCNNDADCVDTCDGSYWYYGDGECSLGCYFNCCKHCKYDNRVCADSDASDNFPKIGCCVKTCNAECDQDSDCSCPEDECIEQDYYDYPEQGVCNEACECDCEPDILVNDTRCKEPYIEVNKTAEPVELLCEKTIITLSVKGIGTGAVGTNVTIIDFLPSFVSLENLTDDCEYDNITKKITCDLNSLNADETKTIEFNVSLTQLGNVLIDLYPDSGVSYINYLGNETFVSFPETYVNVLGYPEAEEICDDNYDNDCDGLADLNDTDCYQCEDNDEDGYYSYSVNCTEGDDCNDSNPNINPGATEVCNDGIDNNCNGKTDCDDPSCSGQASCVAPSPPPGGGGIITGGSLFGTGQIKEAICGNGICEASEKCSSCPEDCLKEGEICCDNITYVGNCCVDADCEEGYECNITKYCYPLYIKEEIEEPEVCEEDWLCTEWTECEENIQARGCVDRNNCGTTINKPVEVEECEMPPEAPTGLFIFDSPSDLAFLIVLIFLIILIIFLSIRTRK